MHLSALCASEQATHRRVSPRCCTSRPRIAATPSVAARALPFSWLDETLINLFDLLLHEPLRLSVVLAILSALTSSVEEVRREDS